MRTNNLVQIAFRILNSSSNQKSKLKLPLPTTHNNQPVATADNSMILRV